ncbi:MAG: hypothetical protein RL701_611 [Pseudomonadota bacterium]
MTEDDQAALMQAFIRGDEAAYVTLYRAYRDRIVGYCTRLLGDQARGEEAAQDVFIKLYRARSTYAERGQFGTFLYRIATNHCFNLRAQLDQRLVERRKELDENAHAALHDPAAQLASSELRAALQSALADLPDKQRAAFVLVHDHGLGYREAASALTVTESALKSLIHRARETMMRRLGRYLSEPSEVDHAV